jgi:hypothetical protein
MSGYIDDTLLRHGTYEAREAFLQKPFALQAFASKVRQILNQEYTCKEGETSWQWNSDCQEGPL